MSGYTLSIPTTAFNYTGESIVDDGTTRLLGTPIATIVGNAGISASSSFRPSAGTPTNTSIITNAGIKTTINNDATTRTITGTTTGNASGTTAVSTPMSKDVSSSAIAVSVSCYHAADPNSSCPAIADGLGWCVCDDGPALYAIMPWPALQPCAWTPMPPTTSFDCSASASTSAGGSSGSESSTISQIGTAAPTITNVSQALSINTIGDKSLGDNFTSLVAGTATVAPGGPSMTSSGQTIFVPTTATNSQLEGTRSTASLSTSIMTSETGPVTINTVSLTFSNPAASTGTNSTIPALPMRPSGSLNKSVIPPVSTSTIDGTSFTGNTSVLVASTSTSTLGGLPHIISEPTISIKSSVTDGRIRNEGNSTQLTASNSASRSDSVTQFEFEGAIQVPILLIRSASTALVVAVDSPPNPEGTYYPYVTGLEGCTSIVVS